MVTNGDSAGNIGDNEYEYDDLLATMMIHWSYSYNGSNDDNNANGFTGRRQAVAL